MWAPPPWSRGGAPNSRESSVPPLNPETSDALTASSGEAPKAQTLYTRALSDGQVEDPSGSVFVSASTHKFEMLPVELWAKIAAFRGGAPWERGRLRSLARQLRGVPSFGRHARVLRWLQRPGGFSSGAWHDLRTLFVRLSRIARVCRACRDAVRLSLAFSIKGK